MLKVLHDKALEAVPQASAAAIIAVWVLTSCHKGAVDGSD